MSNGDLGRQLADLARDIQDEDDLSAATDRIVAVAAEMVGGPDSAAGITMVHNRRRLDTPAATSQTVRRGDQLQYELGEGPCVDAVWNQRQVCSDDLRHDPRWPTWAPKVADELGVRSMVCTQLFTHENHLGALNIYSLHANAFNDEAQEIALLIAAHAAVAFAAAQQIDGLKIAVDRRTTIGKALGMLMITYRLTDDQAFAVLQRLSSHQNRKLYDVAEHVVRIRKLPTDLPLAN